MPVFFQKISDDQFNFDADFLVKESKTMNSIVGIFFLILSFVAFFNSVLLGGLALLIAIGALVRSSKDITVMKINKTGFYYHGELITDWDHFISEQFIDELPLPSSTSSGMRDRFFLMIKYYKDGKPGYFGRKICLTDSQDKSEEEIIAAVKFYSNHFEKSVRQRDTDPSLH